MAVETDDDRLDLLSDWDSANYNGSATIFCIFDAEYLQVSDDTGIESTSPAAYCRATDVSDAVHGTDFVHNDVSYKVRGVQKTGDGYTLLKLEAV